MNKNVVYVSLFGVLCVFAGVLLGASIVRQACLPWYGHGRPDFAEKAERFMGYGMKDGHGWKRHGSPIDMLTDKLNLDQGQRAKVERILEDARVKIDKTGKDLRGVIKGIKEESDKKIMEVLTPEQKDKFKEIQAKFRKRIKMMRGEECDEEEGAMRPPKGLPPLDD
ncbi:MAG: hypothetical protein PHO34_01360 [Candidatus Omnitrophica bacterium]|nr:hypothetical protein [Candidatus Omnitrophota bacterium]MDD5042812.1 hypothetical protein [Candidatus Omnitrophota bacterium]MDD5501207.1 hypothetical protein [Candidatus Omnitrophota bacterium]